MSRELARRGHDVLVVAPDGHDRARYDTPAHVARFGAVLKLPANGSRAPAHALAARVATRARRSSTSTRRRALPRALRAARSAWSTCCARTRARPWRRSIAVAADRRCASPVRCCDDSRRGLDVSAAVSDVGRATIDAACGIEPTVLFNGFEMERFVATPRERARGDVCSSCSDATRSERAWRTPSTPCARTTRRARTPGGWSCWATGRSADRSKRWPRATRDRLRRRAERRGEAGGGCAARTR
jgi:hypothetical protein